MTVGEFIEELKKYDLNAEIYVGVYQKYGRYSAHDILEIREHRIEHFSGEKSNEKKPILIKGRYIGTITDWKFPCIVIADNNSD